MNKLKRCISIILFICLIILTFSACSGSSSVSKNDNSTAACILLGNTNNVRTPSSKTLESELIYIAQNQGECSVIVIDGEPDEISFTKSLKFPKRIGKSEQQANNESYVKSKMEDIMKCTPKEEEIDILKALSEGGKALKNKDAKNKKLIIYSSGISTAGLLNFAQNPNLLYEKPEEILKTIENNKSCPDFSGIDVVWYGLGDVDDNQEKLNDYDFGCLKEIWSAILEKGGVEITDSTFNETPPIESSNDFDVEKKSFPSVSIVDFTGLIVITDKEVSFNSGKATFKYPKAAESYLKDCAENIMHSPNHSFYVVGSTASADTNEKCMNLSIKRAQAVKNVLCRFGVPSSELIIYGIGRETLSGSYNWRVNDLDKKGKLIENKAQKNRKVMIIDASSDMGKDFLRQYKSITN